MVGATNLYYGEQELQGLADFVKFRLFGTAVNATLEDSYDPMLANFIGKLTTLQFIPAAIDFWGDQLLQENTTGTNESVMYPDRRDGLLKIFDEIRAEVKETYPEMTGLYGFIVYGGGELIPSVSYGDMGRGVLLTKDPMKFPPADNWARRCRDLGLIWTEVQ
jgi:hypothetical protein